MELKIQNRLNYKGKLHIKKYDITITFYTNKQMKSIYPNKNFRVVGEVGNKTGVQCGAAENLNGQPLPVYKEKTHNILTESVVGYTAVDDHTYLAVVKNVLIKRIFILFLILAVIAAGVAIGIAFHFR